MMIKNPERVEAKTMTMPGASGVTMRLMVGQADGAPNFAMRLFEVAPGGHTPYHQHNYEHEVLIIEGQCVLSSGDLACHDRTVSEGDVVFIPANELHQFRNTGPGAMKFMCMVPTRFDCGGTSQPTPGS